MFKIYYYKLKDKVLFSNEKHNDLSIIDENEAKLSEGTLFHINTMNPKTSRRCFCVNDPTLLFIKKEDTNLLNRINNINTKVPRWIEEKIELNEVMSVNKNHPTWKEVLHLEAPKKWRINIVGLGDVGGTLLTGLRLLGGDYISNIGIYSRKSKTIKRWLYEMNQVLDPFNDKNYPEVMEVSKDKLFDCDIFVFCASKGVPPVGDEKEDVRMVQFKGNSEIIKEYSILARDKNFKGIFAVVSDPVDLLCKVALIESNKDKDGHYDNLGLAPEQVRGYGLGVMNARATYYAKKDNKTIHYLKEGRAYGPHGEGLIIADSIENYNEEISDYLTEKAKSANLKVRETGYKPYIAPALSSGALSILATIKGSWNYSATYMGGVFIGAKNRLTPSGVEVEILNLPNSLYKKIKETHEKLGDII